MVEDGPGRRGHTDTFLVVDQTAQANQSLSRVHMSFSRFNCDFDHKNTTDMNCEQTATLNDVSLGHSIV